MSSRVFAITAGAVLVAGLATWGSASQASGAAPRGHYTAASTGAWPLPQGRDEQLRDEALQRAAVFVPPSRESSLEPPLTCRFLADRPSGTSAKFNCVLDGGDVIKVKYGRNPEIQAEIVASHLLAALGFPADDVSLSRRVRCYGCPRYPFFTMQVLSLIGASGALKPHGHDLGYTDFEWVAVERKFPAAPIETSTRKGWSWWELKTIAPPRPDIDALRLLAVFLAHWDNKAENQRLACLDPLPASPQPCAHPILIVHDLGSTLGPFKLNVVRWTETPVWANRQTCTISMRAFPYTGATFPDAQISEAGRVELARRLATLTDADVRQLFEEARVPELYAGTDDRRDLDAWTLAFRHRVDQIVDARCASTAEDE